MTAPTSPPVTSVAPKPTLPSCSSYAGDALTPGAFAKGCIVDAATAALVDVPVGKVFVAKTVPTSCVSGGRVLFWNELGWGYEDRPFQIRRSGADVGAPSVETVACATPVVTIPPPPSTLPLPLVNWSHYPEYEQIDLDIDIRDGPCAKLDWDAKVWAAAAELGPYAANGGTADIVAYIHTAMANMRCG